MIPTAEEFLKQDEGGVYSEQDIIHMMIEFAKLHVKKALQKSCKDARIIREDGTKCSAFGINSKGDYFSGEICKHSITNAYPLENIK